MKNPQAILNTPRRMDFVLKTESADSKEGVVNILMKPDPRRHQRVTHNGEDYYRDIFLGELVSVGSVNEKIATELKNLPIHYLSPRIHSSKEYTEDRLAALKHETLTGDYVKPNETPKMHSGLEPSEEKRWIGFISVDICNSTQLSADDQQNYTEAYQLFFREMGTLVGQFNGEIFKPTGDGFLALINHPSFTRVADNLADFGQSAIMLLGQSINPILKSQGLPEFSIRVGAECGWASVGMLEVAATGYSSVDISSHALSQAVKIESSAGANEMRIGQALHATLHVNWLLRCEKVKFDGNPIGDTNYDVYRIH